MAIQFYLTEAGQRNAVQAEQLQLKVKLKTLVLGLGQYDAQQQAPSMTTLQQSYTETAIQYAHTHDDGTMQLHSMIEATKTQKIYELGILTDDGTLFAVASSADKELLTLVENTHSLFMLGVKLVDVTAPIQVIVDNDTGLALSLMRKIETWQDVPLGSLFLTTLNFPNAEAVRKYKGYGRWKRFGDGHAVITQQHTTPESGYAWKSRIGATGGEDTHRLSIDEMPEHKHSQDDIFNKFGSKASESGLGTAGSIDSGNPVNEYGIGHVGNRWNSATESKVGKNKSHNNVQRSIVIGAWLRIPEPSDFLSLSANVERIAVGQTAEFSLKTKLPPYFTVPYHITGVTTSQISHADLNGFLTIDEQGEAKLSLRAGEDYVATGDKTLSLNIVDSDLSATVVVIDSGETVAPTHTYYTGTHQITVEPNQIATFDLFAGGGGGGGSRWTTFRENNDGQDGANVVLTLDNANLTAGGGRKGTEGWWGNGSHYGNGSAGAGGNNNIVDENSLFEILVNQRGTDGKTYNRYETQRGAEVVAEAMAGSNAGGNGGNGVGDERWSYGGAGGSGGRIKARYTNHGESVVTIQLQIGQTAKGGQHQSKGGDGGFAYATVSVV